MNVKTPDKGVNLRNELLNPINTRNDPSLDYLRNFIVWLQQQIPLRGKFLTGQTFKACYLTTNGVIRCCEYLLNSGYCGILSGVFQSDPLEKRFGLYRLTQGSNYHIDTKSLSQSEKKLRISSIVDLSNSLDNLADNLDELKRNASLIPEIQSHEIIKYCNILFSSKVIDETKVTDQCIVYFIVGYCVYKIFHPKNNICKECEIFFKGCKISELSSYVDQFDNGFLTHATFYILKKVFF